MDPASSTGSALVNGSEDNVAAPSSQGLNTEPVLAPHQRVGSFGERMAEPMTPLGQRNQPVFNRLMANPTMMPDTPMSIQSHGHLSYGLPPQHNPYAQPPPMSPYVVHPGYMTPYGHTPQQQPSYAPAYTQHAAPSTYPHPPFSVDPLAISKQNQEIMEALARIEHANKDNRTRIDSMEQRWNTLERTMKEIFKAVNDSKDEVVGLASIQSKVEQAAAILSKPDNSLDEKLDDIKQFMQNLLKTSEEKGPAVAQELKEKVASLEHALQAFFEDFSSKTPTKNELQTLVDSITQKNSDNNSKLGESLQDYIGHKLAIGQPLQDSVNTILNMLTQFDQRDIISRATTDAARESLGGAIRGSESKLEQFGQQLAQSDQANGEKLTNIGLLLQALQDKDAADRIEQGKMGDSLQGLRNDITATLEAIKNQSAVTKSNWSELSQQLQGQFESINKVGVMVDAILKSNQQRTITSSAESTTETIVRDVNGASSEQTIADLGQILGELSDIKTTVLELATRAHDHKTLDGIANKINDMDLRLDESLYDFNERLSDAFAAMTDAFNKLVPQSSSALDVLNALQMDEFKEKLMKEFLSLKDNLTIVVAGAMKPFADNLTLEQKRIGTGLGSMDADIKTFFQSQFARDELRSSGHSEGFGQVQTSLNQLAGLITQLNDFVKEKSTDEKPAQKEVAGKKQDLSRILNIEQSVQNILVNLKETRSWEISQAQKDTGEKQLILKDLAEVKNGIREVISKEQRIVDNINDLGNEQINQLRRLAKETEEYRNNMTLRTTVDTKELGEKIQSITNETQDIFGETSRSMQNEMAAVLNEGTQKAIEKFRAEAAETEAARARARKENEEMKAGLKAEFAQNQRHREELHAMKAALEASKAALSKDSEALTMDKAALKAAEEALAVEKEALKKAEEALKKEEEVLRLHVAENAQSAKNRPGPTETPPAKRTRLNTGRRATRGITEAPAPVPSNAPATTEGTLTTGASEEQVTFGAKELQGLAKNLYTIEKRVSTVETSSLTILEDIEKCRLRDFAL